MNTNYYKTMNILFKMVFAFAFLILGIFLEDNVRGAGLILGLFILCVGFIIEKLINKYRGHDYYYLRGLGTTFCILFFCGLGQGVDIEPKDEGIVEVRSPFLRRLIERGQRLEVLNLRTYYSRYFQDYNVEKEDYYLIYHYQGDSSYISVYNHSKLLQLPDTCFEIKEIDGGHGGETIQYIQCRQRPYFLRGSVFNDKFQAYVLDITPESNF